MEQYSGDNSQNLVCNVSAYRRRSQEDNSSHVNLCIWAVSLHVSEGWVVLHTIDICSCPSALVSLMPTGAQHLTLDAKAGNVTSGGAVTMFFVIWARSCVAECNSGTTGITHFPVCFKYSQPFPTRLVPYKLRVEFIYTVTSDLRNVE